MSNDDKPSQELTTQQRAAVGKSVRNGVSGRLKAALDDMTWNGTPWEASAVKAGMTVRSMRLALKRPQVLKYLRTERGVLMAQASASTFHRLNELMRQDENRGAAVAAARTIEGMTTEALGGPRAGNAMGGPRAGYLIDLTDDQTPGVTINIVTNSEPPLIDGRIIDVIPTEGPSSKDR